MRKGTHRGSRRRRRWILSTAILLVAVSGIVTYYYEPAPDTADAVKGAYWVSTHGSDKASGSSHHPWRTPAHAVADAPAGATIYLRHGTYAPFTISRADQTVTSAPKEKATIDGNSGTRDVVLITGTGVTFSDLTVQGCVPAKDPDIDVTGSEGSGIRVAATSGVTVSGVTVRDSHGTTSAGKKVGCYGVLVTGSSSVEVKGSELYHNGAGIVVSGGGKNVVVSGNYVHDQDRIVVNTAAANDDFGGYGLGATFVDADPGPAFSGNTVERNYGPSTDYTTDGGGVELYDAYNVSIAGNTFTNNDGVLETGSGSTGTCSGDTFTGNTMTGGSEPSGLTTDTGLLLRCGEGFVVKDNTFTDLQSFTMLLITGDDFSGSIANTQITGNKITRASSAVVYRLQYASTTPTVSIDSNTYAAGTSANFAILNGLISESAVSFASWQSKTGYDANSTDS